MVTTLAANVDVQAAGNLTVSLDSKVISFYLDLGSFFIKQLIGDEVYADALLETPETLIAEEKERIKKAEALMAVALMLPALGIVTASTGAFKTMSIGSGGSEVVLLAKELQELAGSFITLVQNLLFGFILDDGYKSFWSSTVMKMFPSLNEIPNVAMIHSWRERKIKDYQREHQD